MKDIGKWQFISFLSRGGATFIGLVQTFIIVRLLSKGEWGLVQLAISIGGALGIYQHLGLASASTREISSAKNDDDIFKIFVTSAVIRYAVTLPLAIGLFFFAHPLAVNLYKNELLVLPLQIYAITLLFQGFQSILNSVISGTKRFKNLFIYQVVIAFVNFVLFVPFIYFFKVSGYFYAFLAFNAVNTVALWFLAFKPLKGKLRMPKYPEFKLILKDIFSISIGIYLVKILATNWEKIGTNILGVGNSTEFIATFAFALLFAKKILSISDAVTDVNLPVFSDHFAKDPAEFKKAFKRNFSKLFVLIIFTATVASLWAKELILVALGSQKLIEYHDAIYLIPPLLLGFIVYSFIDIVKSSVLVPAKMTWQMTVAFFVLLASTGVIYVFSSQFLPSLEAMSWSMAGGAIVAFWLVTYLIKLELNFEFYNIDHLVIMLEAYFVSTLNYLTFNPLKILIFIVLGSLLLSSFVISGDLKKEDLIGVSSRLRRKK
jgi:O-antigen/teichoic acid export membrane protein